jgi:predicted DCC family thiol-disulfide oxidoreductase YuxK
MTRTDPSPEPPAARGRDVILFDGVCNLCNHTVRFVVRRDPRGRFAFASLQSRAAERLLASAGARAPLPDSIVLLSDDRLHTRSGAALRIARGLRFPWWLLSAFLLVPAPLRDWAYDRIARNRYRWFGKRDSCMTPTPEQRSRFLPD